MAQVTEIELLSGKFTVSAAGLISLVGATFSLDAGSKSALKAALAYAIADVSGLQAALDGKAALGHTHAIPKLDALAQPDDTTTRNADIFRHGLLPKLSGVPTEFLNGLGDWATPDGGGGGGGNVFNSVVLTANVPSSPGSPGSCSFSLNSLADGMGLTIEYVTPYGNSTWYFEFDDNSNLDNGAATPVTGTALADFVAAIDSSCGGQVTAIESSGNLVLTTSGSGSGHYFNISGTIIDSVAYNSGGYDGDPGFSGVTSVTLFTIPTGKNFKLTGATVNGNGNNVSTSGVEIGILKDGTFYPMLSLGSVVTNGNSSIYGWPGNPNFGLQDYLALGTLNTGTAATIVARYIDGTDNSAVDASVTIQALGQMW